MIAFWCVPKMLSRGFLSALDESPAKLKWSEVNQRLWGINPILSQQIQDYSFFEGGW
jgi:hypothetical protein